MESTCEGVPPIPSGSTFTVWDYLVFGIVLAISVSIGIYYAFTGGRQKTTQEYLLANRSMSAFPVAVSLFASLFSAVTLLGLPAEMYTQGTMYWMGWWGVIFGPILGATVFGPFFHRLKILSAFEYLELRFKSKSVRILGCLMTIVKYNITIGIVMFAPSAAFTEVTGFPVWATIVTIGIVCAFYTTLGGMKAVIWADVFQTAIMFAGMLAAIIQGCIEIGGFQKIWKLANDGGRIDFFNFSPDPTVRHTFWALIIGNLCMSGPFYMVEQQMVQRYASTRNMKQATIALLLNVPGIFIIFMLGAILGVVIFGYYANMKCDPLTSGRVTNPNQLVPRFVMDIFGFAPGIAGLYIASLFAGALSTVSSVLNALCTVVWEDICKMFRPAREASDKTATLATKILGAVFAACGIGMAFVFSNAGGTVLQMMIAFNGASVAPIFGIYLLGIFFPWTNWIGALAGGIPGFILPMWIGIGAYVKQPNVYKPMHYDIECCAITPDNSTSSYFFTTDLYTTNDLYTTSTTTPVSEGTGIDGLYTLSYLWFTPLGILTTVVVGLIVSFLTGPTKPEDIDPKLLMSYVDKFWCCFPESCRSKFRCGVDYSKADDKDSISDVDNPEKPMEVFHNGMNIITVDPDHANLEGNDEEPRSNNSRPNGNSEFIINSAEELSTSKRNSRSYVSNRNDSNGYNTDKVEVSEL